MARDQSRASANSSYLSPAGPRVFAHRGLALDAPENTMLAFAKAVAAGVQFVETDVHVSFDGVAVVAHDPSLSRVAGRAIKVEQLTMAELRRIDLGDGQGFCALADALDAFPETRFNVDVKTKGAVLPVSRAIRDLKAVDRVLVTSFDEARRAATVEQLPGIASSASARRFLMALVSAKAGISPAMRRALSGLVAIQVPEKALGLRVTTQRMISRVHDLGLEMHVWTINEPQRMRHLLDLGVDGIVTDRADLALEVVKSRA
ncbi:glycerophosphodiester phosphodiesterase family protein [Salinibacterium sp. SWN1162]|uniref:glycerophosphodiester phosphodiesterase family protein n=1 Tax=Salinibacterium sp. SWN1162 TaxID=2792053 RepID=UPI0018CEBFD1|nr:glycerophosphodiester phosphodiesterase family protein [Salinibacterium sp. SWN1162]MBH0009412.1 glycerophosphodiester phosphodiesterase [Salinibacterium sp. SWN1162]